MSATPSRTGTPTALLQETQGGDTTIMKMQVHLEQVLEGQSAILQQLEQHRVKDREQKAEIARLLEEVRCLRGWMTTDVVKKLQA